MKSFSRATWVCIAYFGLHLATHLSARLFEISPGISVWYPPAGLALGLLILLGARYAPVVFAANIAGALLVGSFRPWWSALVYPALITLNYAAVAELVRRRMGGRLLPGTMAGTVAFAVVVFISPIGAALLGSLVSISTGWASWETFVSFATQWWIGDASGVLTVVPLLMVFVSPWLDRRPVASAPSTWGRASVFAVVAEGLALFGSLWFAFAQDTLPYGTLYICFLPLIWICLRHGLPGATVAVIVLIMGALVWMHFVAQGHLYLLSFLLFGLAVSVLGLGLGSVVSRRNEALAELSTSRARFDRVIAGAQLGHWEWDITTGAITWNDRCAEMLRCRPEQLPADRAAWEHHIHPSDQRRQRQALDAHLRGETRLYECEYRVQRHDRQWLWIQSRGSVVSRQGTTPLVFSGTHADITDRKMAEEAAQRLLAIVENNTDFVLTIDVHGRVAYANQALLRIVGRERSTIEGESFLTLFPPAAADVIQAQTMPTAFGGGSWHGELVIEDTGRHAIPISCVAIVHRGAQEEGSLLSFIMRDISAQKVAEAAKLDRERRILQVQKAESLSVLAGGVAHDFNNLLTAIFGNVELARDQLAGGGSPTMQLSQIEIAAGRAAELCRNMLAYSGRFHLSPTDLDLNAVVEESRRLITAAISKKITLRTDLGARLALIKGSTTQLQQVVINLVLNAGEAIGDRPGEITLRTSHREFDHRTLTDRFDAAFLQPGRYVVLEVADTGCGIPTDLREKIFEPFFTTKPSGHGLGLSAVNGIIRAHGGTIHIESEVGHGSVFRILLPAVDPTPDRPAASAPDNAAWRGSGLALVVDDEPLVQNVIARMIERLGFQTLTATDGVEAVSLFKKHHAVLRFVLTDLTMPRMSGDEAMVEMRRVNPHVPIVLMSGYPEKMAADHFGLASPSALLVKPLRVQVVQQTLARVLEEK